MRGVAAKAWRTRSAINTATSDARAGKDGKELLAADAAEPVGRAQDRDRRVGEDAQHLVADAWPWLSLRS